MGASAVVQINNVSHYYGAGRLRKQILKKVSAQVYPGEIVVMTGPSGSGKTTLLTLIGALRSTQEGSLKVLGQELRGASKSVLVRIRRSIGYVFQHHNLLDSLTAVQNVQMSMALHPEVPGHEARRRSEEMLKAVGLEEFTREYPRNLSGGQKQRVAIARALVGRPQLILADEPTAALDKKSGRDVMELMQSLAKTQACSVVIVTHDYRILDVAERLFHIEDGDLSEEAASERRI